MNLLGIMIQVTIKFRLVQAFYLGRIAKIIFEIFNKLYMTLMKFTKTLITRRLILSDKTFYGEGCF